MTNDRIAMVDGPEDFAVWCLSHGYPVCTTTLLLYVRLRGDA